MSAVPNFTMRQLIEAGVHFGHKTKRWNPRMAPYLFGVRNDIHIIDLGKTVPLLHQALDAVRKVAENNGRVLFVGTKRQAAEGVAEAAKRCGQYYINQRWLGGLLTNWNTIQNSIKTLKKLEEQLAQPESGFTKKEQLSMTRDRDKLESSLGGIKNMGGRPDLLFIIDITKEDLAVKEAQKLGIPIVAIIDSNASPADITYPIPGNDDSTRAIQLYCELITGAVLAGVQQSMIASPQDKEMDPMTEEMQALAEHKPDEADTGRRSGRNARGGAAAKKAPVVQVKKTVGKSKKDESEE